MLRSFLAGAAIGALIDAWTLIPVSGSAVLAREYLLLTIGGTMASALIFAALAWAGLHLPIFAKARVQVDHRGAFLPGLLFGVMPILISFLPEALAMYIGGLPMGLGFVVWSIPAGVLLLLALPMPFTRLLGGCSKLHFLALALVAFATLFTWLRPAAVQTDIVLAPPYPDSELDAIKKRYLARGNDTVASDAPDLVVVSIDTLRTDLRRDDRFVLPVFEELRSEAAWHAAGYSTSNQTVPGHIGMLAGLSPEQHVVGQNSEFVRVPLDQMMAKRLHGAGYRTAGVVSNAMANYFWPGYESWDNSRATYGRRFFFMRSAGRTAWLARLVNPRRSQNLLARWLRVDDVDLLPPGMSRYTTDSALRLHSEMVEAGGQPLHLFVHYMDPHSPYSPPESTAGTFSGGRALPKRYLHWKDDHRILINRV
ncbi:MAG: sulfatase-like hydrolase/transferase, partial [Planctomycetes bacterium]|nr:sulfatase-like hydrolase/transferase [Planctomycetota bacterium]